MVMYCEFSDENSSQKEQIMVQFWISHSIKSEIEAKNWGQLIDDRQMQTYYI